MLALVGTTAIDIDSPPSATKKARRAPTISLVGKKLSPTKAQAEIRDALAASSIVSSSGPAIGDKGAELKAATEVGVALKTATLATGSDEGEPFKTFNEADFQPPSPVRAGSPSPTREAEGEEEDEDSTAIFAD